MKNKFQKLRMFILGGMVGMCFKYHFRLNPDHNYALYNGISMGLFAIFSIFSEK